MWWWALEIVEWIWPLNWAESVQNVSSRLGGEPGWERGSVLVDCHVSLGQIDEWIYCLADYGTTRFQCCIFDRFVPESIRNWIMCNEMQKRFDHAKYGMRPKHSYFRQTDFGPIPFINSIQISVNIWQSAMICQQELLLGQCRWNRIFGNSRRMASFGRMEAERRESTMWSWPPDIISILDWSKRVNWFRSRKMNNAFGRICSHLNWQNGIVWPSLALSNPLAPFCHRLNCKSVK